MYATINAIYTTINQQTKTGRMQAYVDHSTPTLNLPTNTHRKKRDLLGLAGGSGKALSSVSDEVEPPIDMETPVLDTIEAAAAADCARPSEESMTLATALTLSSVVPAASMATPAHASQLSPAATARKRKLTLEKPAFEVPLPHEVSPKTTGTSTAATSGSLRRFTVKEGEDMVVDDCDTELTAASSSPHKRTLSEMTDTDNGVPNRKRMSTKQKRNLRRKKKKKERKRKG